MPNRYLRQNYIESETVNKVGWQAEVVWTRLLVVVDDWGRCEASPRLLRAKIFPLKLELVRESDLQRWISECETAGLVRLYEVQGKQYLQMMKWEKGRATKSKWPDPPEEIMKICFQLQAAVRGCTQTKTFPPTPTPVPTPTPIPIPTHDSDGRARDCPVELPHGFPKTAEEAVAHADFAGCPPDFARKCWTKAAGRGGCDGKDVPIRSFRHHLKVEWTYEQEWQAKAKGSGEFPRQSLLSPTDVILHSKELERVEERIKTIRGTYSGMQTWAEDDKAEIKKLKVRREELRQMLNVKV